MFRDVHHFLELELTSRLYFKSDSNYMGLKVFPTRLRRTHLKLLFFSVILGSSTGSRVKRVKFVKYT